MDSEPQARGRPSHTFPVTPCSLPTQSISSWAERATSTICLYDEKWNRLLRRSIALVTMKAHDTVQFWGLQMYSRRACSPPDDAHRTHRRKGSWKCHSHASHSGLHRTCWRWRWWSPPHTIACTISRVHRPLCDYRLCGVDKEESVILLRAKPNSTRIICLPSTQSNSIIDNVNLPSIVHSTSSFVHGNHHSMNYNLSNLKRVR